MKKIWIKALAYMLAVTMCFSAVHVPVYAQGSTVTEVSTEAEITSEAVTATVLGNDAAPTTEEVVSAEEVTTNGNDGSTWDQVTTENVFEGENYRLTFTLTSNWDTGYNANVKLENTGDSTIQNWYLGFDYNNSITNIWNAEVSSNEGNRYVIKNVGWNQDIAVGNNIEFGISGDHAFKGFPENYELIGISTEVTTDGNDGSTWDQVTTENVFEGENYKVTFTLTSNWDTGYNANIKLENTGDSIIQNWYLGFDYNNSITNIWNAEVSSNESNWYVIKNVGWNQDIAVGNSIEFGISCNHAFKGFPENYELIGTITEVTEDDYAIQYIVDSDWGTGYTSTISIRNNSDTVLEDWVLEFDFDRNITEIWNGVIEEYEGNHYIVRNADYNSTIAPGESVSIGIKGCDGESGDEPINFVLQSYSEHVQEEVALAVDTSMFTYNEVADWYMVDAKIEKLSGTLSGAKGIKFLSYEVKDFRDNVIAQDVINVTDEFAIHNFGLSIGYNELVIIAETKNGVTVEETVRFFNTNVDNIKGTDVDLTDSDEDGLNNYYEELIGTDSNLKDTDGDQLTDYQEITLSSTDPTKKDTDGNGVNDGVEDPDKDSIDNVKEIELGTKCVISDTDGDALSDGDEVNVYGTNPLVKDTDGDTLLDGQDVELSFNPTKIDTDDNGISDADEKVHQTYSKEINNAKTSGILNVSVSLECNGYLGDNVYIQDIYDLDMRSSEVVGLVGSPVEITVNSEFETADIVFTYDESALGEAKEDNLSMMWYDEENDMYVVLDSVLDREKNTIKYTTTHFSTYLIIDKEIWLDNMRMDMNYRNSGEVTYYDMALVVDVSGSMQGTRIKTARTALEKFVEAMMNNDRAGLVKFNSYATRVLDLTSDQTTLKSKISGLGTSGGTNADAGILEGIRVLESAEEGKEKMLILVCDGDVYYNSTTVQNAIDNGIKIHCINVVNGSSSAMTQIASATGGMYYYAATTSDIAKVIEKLTGNTISTIDVTDTDGDGLYDVYEVNGMRLSNGQIVYTDPNKVDTDGDGINDYDAMGGEPVTENIYIDGNVYSCTLNHSNIYGKLSSEFIYVDGRLNSDGKQYDGKMDYLPFSYEFLKDKYETLNSYTMYGESRTFSGAAGIHKLFYDKQSSLSGWDWAGYATVSSLIYLGITLSTLDGTAMDVFDTYTSGCGGDEEAWVDGYTRKTINASSYILNPISNPAYDRYIENIIKTRTAVEGILNDYNQEAYISVSPNIKWSGSEYVDYTTFEIRDVTDVLFNIAAFGTFNSTDAGITAHCTYDPATEKYTLEYDYYLIDFYDYSFLDVLQEQDALGITRSFELYGKLHLIYSWKKGDSSMYPVIVA